MFVFGGQALEKKHPSPSTQNHGLQACWGVAAGARERTDALFVFRT